MTEKVTKSSVNYEPGDSAERCHNCAMYHTGKLFGSCDLVEGKIAPEYVCNKWVEK
jgi:hypothetical protein